MKKTHFSKCHLNFLLFKKKPMFLAPDLATGLTKKIALFYFVDKTFFPLNLKEQSQFIN